MILTLTKTELTAIVAKHFEVQLGKGDFDIDFNIKRAPGTESTVTVVFVPEVASPASYGYMVDATSTAAAGGVLPSTEPAKSGQGTFTLE